MRRGGFFIIAVASAVITIISLNAAFGRPGYFNERYGRYGWHHRCYGDDYYRNRDKHDKRKNPAQQDMQRDSATRNY